MRLKINCVVLEHNEAYNPDIFNPLLCLLATSQQPNSIKPVGERILSTKKENDVDAFECNRSS